MIDFPIRTKVIRKPPRSRRILWDHFHDIKYPNAFIPKDTLSDTDTLDWLGDHPYTNFHGFFRALRRAGFFIDIWNQPLSCIHDEQVKEYGFLMIVDPEEEYSEEDIASIHRWTMSLSVSLVVLADWYNDEIAEALQFKDESSRSTWKPVSAGSNIPALNRILKPYEIEFSNRVISGTIRTDGFSFRVKSAASLSRVPLKSEVLTVSSCTEYINRRQQTQKCKDEAVFVLSKRSVLQNWSVLAFGDTHCLDSAYTKDSNEGNCYSFLIYALERMSLAANLNANQAPLYSSSFRGENMIMKGIGLLELSSKLKTRLLPHSLVIGESGFSEWKLLCHTATADETRLTRVRHVGREAPFNFPMFKKAVPIGELTFLSKQRPAVKSNVVRVGVIACGCFW
eukprot:CAMPEP_0182446408 /NCGR_PEP_ID=MMETSP1172-20130603/4185_1 /TAXON_ID=708627 /ORGANISM="Timspurckia oligopyrenoides, Strain CCMP3278" /LENGTH=395 /DNA_ID=CAMNT_0024642337 /DNA_START=323 /DNA_END=1507 /DNA_ORIENTATION=-